ncbi:hypothetical protein A8709_00895 [Paenibacillus pectinilyticus]|uniref:SLH domain-containing protein n=1 Tax=Paenibacillus pectinilyticus TaxID=512399 RepID=A0A1C1A8I6_9BACL|nr:S-layer homology domain-containing protein [Paenibacillus pectinilyticus]OCT16903.1 hypothetical protein A8709_00895 [Paenibacillus pectinilyticus]
MFIQKAVSLTKAIFSILIILLLSGLFQGISANRAIAAETVSEQTALPELQISQVVFSDSDQEVNEISGLLLWNSTSGSSTITSYTVYFLDQNKNKIGSQLVEVMHAPESGAIYNYPLPVKVLPTDAKYLGVFTKNSMGESLTAATVEIVDQGAPSNNTGGNTPPTPTPPIPTPTPTTSPPTPPVMGGGATGGFFQFAFEDLNPIRGHIHPLVTWSTSIESNYSGYKLTFLNQAGTELSSRDIAKLSNTPNPSVQYRIDMEESQIPADAVYIDIHPVDLVGNVVTEVFKMQIYDNTLQSPIENKLNSALSAPNFMLQSFYDNDVSLGKIGGYVSWLDASSADNGVTSYALYFVDSSNTKLQPIAEVARGNLTPPNQVLNYPNYGINLSYGTAIPLNAVRIGVYPKNAQGEGSVGSYLGLWDSILNVNSNYFEDVDPKLNQISGRLHYTPSIDQKNIKNYRVTFSGDFLGIPIQGSELSFSKGQQTYNWIINQSKIPTDAKFIEVSAVNENGDINTLGNFTLYDNISAEANSTYPLDQGAGNTINVLYFNDFDGDAKEIGGSLSFGQLIPNNRDILHYDLFFADNQGQRIKPILSFPSNKTGYYQTSIPMKTRVPDNTVNLVVYGVSEFGESRFVQIDLEDRVYSAPLTSNQINITNNKEGTADTISITGLDMTDIVSVYRDANSINPFLTSTSRDNPTSHTFQVDQLGTTAGSLFFTIQRNFGIPSVKVQKSYEAEPTTPTSSGGSGGGGMGPVELFNWDIDNHNGKIRITSSIDAEQLKKLSESQFSSGQREIPIDLRATAAGYDFQMSSKLINDIKNKKDDAVLAIITPLGTTRISFHELQEAVKAHGGTDATNIKVSIDALPVNDQISLEHTITSLGGASVGKALSYELSLMDGNKTVATVDTFSEFVGHMMLLPKDFKLNAGETLTGAVWDPTTKKLITVPLTFTPEKDGNPAYVTLWRQGNSIYTVYKTHKSFADIKDDNFAKADIESLAASNVVQGFEDGTFRPDTKVTRAEFATLLVRGLGLKANSSSEQKFSDVNAEDWFSQSVYTAVNVGLIHGYEDGTFLPNQSITHQEAITMISNALQFINASTKLEGAERTRFMAKLLELSLQVDNWASESAALAVKYQIIGANNGVSFQKGAVTTRGETAVWIHKLLQNAEWPGK